MKGSELQFSGVKNKGNGEEKCIKIELIAYLKNSTYFLKIILCPFEYSYTETCPLNILFFEVKIIN